jgi:hypothetical protein
MTATRMSPLEPELWAYTRGVSQTAAAPKAVVLRKERRENGLASVAFTAAIYRPAPAKINQTLLAFPMGEVTQIK